MPTIPEALQTALQHHQAGRLREAEAIYRQILQIEPDQPDALHLLGVIAHHMGRHQIAVEQIRKAIALNPNVAEFHNNLGEAYRALGMNHEAVEGYRRALALKPGFAEAHYNLGIQLSDQGLIEDAITSYRNALVCNPQYAEAHNNLGNALLGQGQEEEAVACYRRALDIKPDYAAAHNNLGNACKAQGRLEEAIECYQRALALTSDYAEAHVNLGNALCEQGSIEEALACYRRALTIKPHFAEAHSNLLLALHYHPVEDPALLFDLHREWNDKYAKSLAAMIAPHPNRCGTDRPLRIGYVSADFRRHPVGYFLKPVLAAHDRSRFELFCYSMVGKEDDFTAEIQASAGTWRNITGMSDENVAATIRNDGIDILVDLSGHTAGNRLLVFAGKPAPIQVAWIGYVDTTGLDTMDYLLADDFVSPPEGAQSFTEQLVKLPGSYLCYEPPKYAPPVSSLPALLSGHLTFGCFNNLSKVSGEVVVLWSRILRELPGSRLVLKTKSLNDQHAQERYRQLFLAQGIQPGRVDLLGSSPHVELLNHYGRIDMALDPFPYTGGLSTCEALWMGVPVITLVGSTFLSRIGGSLLTHAGLTEAVTCSPAQYVERAVKLGKDLEHLSRMRLGLRARVAASLCDAETFVHNLERAYQAMWRRWCESATDGG